MSVLDKNKVFFGLVHYILSEQMNVNWILKTSLIDFVGVSSVLEEKPYKKDSLLDDIVDYVSQIKPYHVQFSKYFEHYQTASEQVNIPKNDWIEPTISMRFDSIKSSPDIVKIFYNVVNSLPESEEYNKIGLEVLNKTDKSFYFRQYTYTDNGYIWEWVKEDIILDDGIYYTTYDDENHPIYNNRFTPLDKSYYTIVDGEIKNEFDKESFLNSHLANRLFYLGIHNLDELKKELNANFKGIEINGSTFDVGRFGYEIYNYESIDYDSPTIIYDYCIVDKNDSFDGFNKSNIFEYDKVYVESGLHKFEIPSILSDDAHTLSVYKQQGSNEPRKYSDYNIQFSPNGNYIDIFNGLTKDEKLILTLEIINEDGSVDVDYAYMIYGYPFTPSTSDVLRREFKYLENGNMYFKRPSSEIDNIDISVLIQSTNGSKKPFNNYTKEDGNIVIDSSYLKHGNHIILVSFDFKYLYDKIYTWEDKYGRSNNIVNLHGDKFLRSKYEDDRPRELVVSYPLSSLITYKFDKDNSNQMFINNYKNDMLYYNYGYNQHMIIEELKYTDSVNNVIEEIKLNNISLLSKVPGKIIVNSEIIEYNEIDKDTNTIKKLKRGMNGSLVYMGLNPKYYPHKLTHEVGDIVYPYYEENIYNYEKNHTYNHHTIVNPRQKSYDCPYGITAHSTVEVLKLPKISLLEDIYSHTTDIILNSCNIVDKYLQDILKNEYTSTKYYGDFKLKINDDVIPFTTIYKDKNNTNYYHIAGLSLPSRFQNISNKIIYSKEDSYIHSSIPEEFDTYSLSMVSSDTGYYMIENDNVIYIYADESLVSTRKENDSIIYYNYLYKIESPVVYDSHDIELGTIMNNIIYDEKGVIYGKIDGDTFYKTKNIITINEDLTIGESYIINVY